MSYRSSSSPADWWTLYQAAVFELNEIKLQQRIAEAEDAIQSREDQLSTLNVADMRERQQLRDAAAALAVLRRISARHIAVRETRSHATGT
jgi:hypothetical protein